VALGGPAHAQGGWGARVRAARVHLQARLVAPARSAFADHAGGHLVRAGEWIADRVGGWGDRTAFRLRYWGGELQRRRGIPRVAGRALVAAGASVHALAGRATLRQSSIEVGLGLYGGPLAGVVHLGQYAVDLGVSASLWSGSLEPPPGAGGSPGTVRHVNVGGGGSLLVGAVGWSRLFGVSRSLELFNVWVFGSKRGVFGVAWMIPNLCSGSLGYWPGRGPGLGVGFAVPLPLPAIFVGGSVTLYSPALGWVEAARRPVRLLGVAYRRGIKRPAHRAARRLLPR
jgi:hypothetical protein